MTDSNQRSPENDHGSLGGSASSSVQLPISGIFIALAVIWFCAGTSQAQGLDHARAAAEAESRGDFAQAAALYTKAIDAGDLTVRNLADAYHYRGNASYFLGRYRAAAADYEETLKIDSANLYAALWLYLAQRRSGLDGRRDLSRRSNARDLFYWPGPVVSLFLDEVTPEEVMEAARDPFLDSQSQLEQECEASYYIGEYYFSQGRPKQAEAYFQNALKTSARDFVEYQAAQQQLKILQGRT